MIEKLIVTNATVLTRKYGAAGWKDIQRAIVRLAAVDALRGITTTLALLDAPGKGIPAVSTPSNRKQCKQAIDALYLRHNAPDYLLLLGGPDVIPHQSLVNPLYDEVAEDGDPDKDIPSDLPYACEAAFSRRIDDFTGPTRVVGRLPDVPGGKDAAVLVRLLDHSSTFNGTPQGLAFAITAKVWKGATAANTRLALGKAAPMGVSPTAGPGWTNAQLGAPIHFINCHGASSDWRFYGDPGTPVAHQAGSINGLLPKGVVVVVECCYGAEIYRPSKKIPVGLAHGYLQEGAAAYLGSTNIAYGEAKAADRCAADILCSDFLKALVGQATTGRALLQARQDYIVSMSGTIDPVAQKTLAQFLLLGDPSLRPFASKMKTLSTKTLSTSVTRVAHEAFGQPKTGEARKAVASHRKHRAELAKRGAQLHAATPKLRRVSTDGVPAQAINLWARQHGMPDAQVLTFEARPDSSAPPQKKALKTGAGKARVASRGGEKVHVLFAPSQYLAEPERPAIVGEGLLTTLGVRKARKSEAKPPIRQIRVWTVRTQGGKVVSYERATSK